MDSSLMSALAGYLTLAESMLDSRGLAGGERAGTGFGPRLAHPNSAEGVSHLVASLEDRKEFDALVKQTARVLGDGNPWAWRDAVANFFRLSRTYKEIFRGQSPSHDSVIDRYAAALAGCDVNVTYLALLDCVEFDEDEMDFGDFQVRKYSEDELNEILKQVVCLDFYRHAVIDTGLLEDYWFLVCTDVVGCPGAPGEADWRRQAFGSEIDLTFSPFSRRVEAALATIALWPWEQGRPTLTLGKSVEKESESAKQHSSFVNFIPFVIQTSDSLTDEPDPAPKTDELEREPNLDPATGEKTGAWRRITLLNLDQRTTAQFKDFVGWASRTIADIKPALAKGKPWSFYQLALSFLVKAFVLRPCWEQLLWNVTALEGLIGDKGGGSTGRLRDRSVTILGDEVRKHFRDDHDIYDLRSRFVHGGTEVLKSKAFPGHVWQAREMARRTAVWMLHFLHHIWEDCDGNLDELPAREDILRALDLGSSAKAVRLASALPEGFPHPSVWNT